MTEHQSNAAQTPCTFELWDYSGTPARIGAAQTGTASTSTANVSTAVFTGVSYAQLATLRVRVYGNADSGTGYIESVDGVSLTVSYMPATNATVTMSSALAVTSSEPAPVVRQDRTASPAVLAAATAKPAPAASGSAVVTPGGPLAAAAGVPAPAVIVAEISPGLELSGFAISGPSSGDTIEHVTVAVTEHQSNASQAPCSIALWDGTSAQIGVTAAGTSSTGTSNVSTATFTGVSYSQLATLRVRVYGNAMPGSGYTESVDGVALTVSYMPASATNVTVTLSGVLAATCW